MRRFYVVRLWWALFDRHDDTFPDHPMRWSRSDALAIIRPTWTFYRFTHKRPCGCHTRLWWPVIWCSDHAGLTTAIERAKGQQP